MTDTPQWNNEPMDARLRDLAREYNRPTGEVPREAMWHAIAPAVKAACTPSVTDITPRIERKRRHIAPYAWGAALAAGLVLGIMLEREVLAPRSSSGQVAQQPVPAQTPRVAVTQPQTLLKGTAAPDAGVATPRIGGTPRSAPIGGEATRVASRGAPAVESRSTDVRGSGAAGRTDAPAAEAQQLYRLAARQTLVQAEALLTAYRAGGTDQRDQESMQQAGRWARDVLTSTRLLLDSPAAKDPQFRALFTDLELVLAQIVQLSGAPLQAGERELIERAMQDRDLLPRLRSAIPAGATTE